MMDRRISVAIDGPAGAGKSTVAKGVAKKLGLIYVDTGALYRTLGYHIHMLGIGPKDTDGVKRLLPDAMIEIRYAEDGSQRMILNGADVTGELRTPTMSDYASKLSALPMVREFLLEQQREMAEKYSVIMDGRDIGTVVLPNADVKIFLTADPEVRAARRLAEMQEKGDKKATLASVLAEMKERDERDSHRKVAPLKQADDAELLDTTGMSLDEVIEAVLNMIKRKLDA